MGIAALIFSSDQFHHSISRSNEISSSVKRFLIWGSKRESQKIPSFRMMKIQSTPRLT